MTLRLCVNNAFNDCSALLVTDTSHAATTDADGVFSVVGSPRHLSWTQSGTGGRIVAYVNKAANLAFDTFIMTRADRHVGHEFRLRSYATYTSSSTDHISSSNWAPTLVGVRSQDFITTAYSQTGRAALGIYLSDGTGGAYSKSVAPFYFCSSFVFPSAQSVGVQMRPYFQGLTNGRNWYLFEEVLTLNIDGLTRAQVDTLQMMPRLMSEPSFLYDDSGYLLADYLWHGLVTSLTVAQAQNDFHSISLEFARLRSYA